jgi:hypothetical protein
MPAMQNKIRTRDYFMKALILGSVKAGIHPDNRKHANAVACRGKEKMYAAKKNLRHDVQVEWTRNAEHDGVEVFDVYGAKLQPSGWHIVRMDFIDEDGQPCAFNTMSLSEEERIAIENALEDEWAFQHSA